MIVSLSRLLDLVRVVQYGRSILKMNWYERFQTKNRERKVMFTLSSKPQIWWFHVVVVQRTAKICAKKRAARLFFLFEPMILLFCGVIVAVAVVVS